MRRRLFALLSSGRRALQADRRGAVALYAGFSSALVLGGGVLAIDFGRLVVLRTQMQNAADSAALSAATQLSGQPGAIARARSLAEQGVRNHTSISDSPGALSLQSISFYSQASPTRVPTSDDFEAAFVEVTLAPHPTENGSSGDDFMDPTNAGRQFIVKENGGGSFAPGNYGLLCPTGSNCGAAPAS